MPKCTRIKSTVFLLTYVAGLYGLVASSADAQSMPTFSATYILENNYVVGGEATLNLTREDDHYQLKLETTPKGLFRLSKKGKIRETAELPSLNPPFLSQKYSYTNFGDKKRSFTSDIDRSQSEATFIRNTKSTRVSIDAHAVDRLSMTLELMQHVQTQPDVENFSIDTIDTNGTRTYSFISRGQVTLNTRLGKLTATRIDRQRSNSRRKTITWLAPIGPDALPVPVRIEQYKNDKMTVRLKISDFNVIE